MRPNRNVFIVCYIFSHLRCIKDRDNSIAKEETSKANFITIPKLMKDNSLPMSQEISQDSQGLALQRPQESITSESQYQQPTGQTLPPPPNPQQTGTPNAQPTGQAPPPSNPQQTHNPPPPPNAKQTGASNTQHQQSTGQGQGPQNETDYLFDPNEEIARIFQARTWKDVFEQYAPNQRKNYYRGIAWCFHPDKVPPHLQEKGKMAMQSKTNPRRERLC